MFYIHGYQESVNSESVITVVSASLKTDINVVAIDYGRLAANNPIVILTLLCPVAHAIAKSFNKLQGSGLDKNKIYVAAHSLGGAVSTQIGASLNFTLPRITEASRSFRRTEWKVRSEGQNQKDFLTNSCNYSNIIPMRPDTPISARGVYYLHTNSKSPFARGLGGTRN